VQISHDFARLPKGEVLVELQPVGRGRYTYVFVHNNPVIPSDSEGSLAGRSENREMFRSLNMTRFAIPRSTLPFCHVEIYRVGVSPADAAAVAFQRTALRASVSAL
jgi:hypothetical protein